MKYGAIILNHSALKQASLQQISWSHTHTDVSKAYAAQALSFDMIPAILLNAFRLFIKNNEVTSDIGKQGMQDWKQIPSRIVIHGVGMGMEQEFNQEMPFSGKIAMPAAFIASSIKQAFLNQVKYCDVSSRPYTRGDLGHRCWLGHQCRQCRQQNVKIVMDDTNQFVEVRSKFVWRYPGDITRVWNKACH